MPPRSQPAGDPDIPRPEVDITNTKQWLDVKNPNILSLGERMLAGNMEVTAAQNSKIIGMLENLHRKVDFLMKRRPTSTQGSRRSSLGDLGDDGSEDDGSDDGDGNDDGGHVAGRRASTSGGRRGRSPAKGRGGRRGGGRGGRQGTEAADDQDQDEGDASDGDDPAATNLDGDMPEEIFESFQGLLTEAYKTFLDECIKANYTNKTPKAVKDAEQYKEYMVNQYLPKILDDDTNEHPLPDILNGLNTSGTVNLYVRLGKAYREANKDKGPGYYKSRSKSPPKASRDAPAPPRSALRQTSAEALQPTVGTATSRSVSPRKRVLITTQSDSTVLEGVVSADSPPPETSPAKRQRTRTRVIEDSDDEAEAQGEA